MAVCNNSFGRRRCPPNPEQDMHSVGGSHIFFTHLTHSIELSLFGIVPASSKRYYLETISIPRTFASCSSLRPHPPLDTGLKFCTPPPAARCENLMLMKSYGISEIDCCIPVVADSSIELYRGGGAPYGQKQGGV